MSNAVTPPGEKLRRALLWLSAEREAPGANLVKLIEQASVRFDLSPAEEEWLLLTLKGQPSK
jgi:hypothetical protein